ncbi:NAD-dependent succinate-semialdehyde dehydrogenase [Oceanicella actignis]|uniref:Succinate-semialdehyde dehydrogenase / glutarate-semialdehyde dehydrogenase n=1 Tax=Oceanicella actignis TaxID=1189325 RepID=A0A1M7TK46_9RHOB|nr:NAD-dependent succinate-semialdehyde dehydrogenase [Oceanicella actignis]TYO88223.1 succinate-semialdehyde dehydrogenase/glutarate-semialdehyde dehydrogenase [Oceanicella actignis]SET67890.1 succinate-semialdehyde dehydrogenase / glutarate-semialdehyde dehydrogenase [Oceanicella actignis]SHN71132.1 succinate-semialdehyde dehydrogenase / glutarate-semialdehyde dehydrogenase [Oceanicella actignis]
MKLKDPTLLTGRSYVGGVWTDGPGGKTFKVVNPATGQTVAECADLGAEETRRAIDAAYEAQKPWAARLASERGALLMKLHDLMVENADDLATILTSEQGKPWAEARGEILYGASFLKWFAAEAERVYGDVIPPAAPGKRIVVLKQPIGVVAAITPWNFPNAMITRKIGPALAVGCTVVCKPAKQTPLSAIAIAVLAERAGFPPGVLNVVCGSSASAIGNEMCANEKVRKLTFTGSTEVGRVLMRQCAHDIKKLGLELGGNAPFIVFDDADLDAAVEGAMASKFRNAGQTCICANRIYVQESVREAFVARLAERVRALRVGDGLEEGVTTGPLIDEAAVAKVEEHIADALAKGGRLVVGGKRHALGGLFFEPTVIDGATAQMKVAREETFGPLAPVFSFSDEAEAIALANDTEFGLAAYFYARDIGRCWRVAEGLEYGIVGVNDALPSTAVAPFGGMKQSGLGREGSKYGIDDFVEIKYLSMGGI